MKLVRIVMFAVVLLAMLLVPAQVFASDGDDVIDVTFIKDTKYKEGYVTYVIIVWPPSRSNPVLADVGLLLPTSEIEYTQPPAYVVGKYATWQGVMLYPNSGLPTVFLAQAPIVAGAFPYSTLDPLWIIRIDNHIHVGS